MVFFFFSSRRRHTRYWRDWSSDVCSSDLIWGGGMAIYDADAPGEVAARAYLITAEQFVDILAQEMRLEPGLDVDLAPVRETGWHSFRPGRYQPRTEKGREGEECNSSWWPNH